MIQSEARDLLLRLIDSWFPRCVEGVGFHQTFDRVWSPLRDDGKFVVFQSRMTWAAASCAEALPERAEVFQSHALHGLDGLRKLFWDAEHGGFHWFGPPIPGVVKQLYGMAFALYALAACSRILRQPEVLEWAKESFDWIDRHLHDDARGGYFEASAWEGTPTALTGKGPPEWKTLNAQMHLFEALLELQRVHPMPRFENRILEMVDVFTRQLYQEEGRLHNRTTTGWTPASDRWEIGHDLEVAYLLLYAEDVLSRRVPGLQEKARLLIDNALAGGFDHELGGFYEWALPSGEKFDVKGWWPQMEGLNALVYACKRFNSPPYRDALELHWSWIRDWQWDAEHGGFFGLVSRRGVVVDDGRKGHAWKAAYHDTRALLTLMAM